MNKLIAIKRILFWEFSGWYKSGWKISEMKVNYWLGN